ncbi:hypothetical protein [Frondihabitans sp. VKM Ac-2883]|nr:hypothetical protein [Frondihabitans sp. VKM Ac-2883]
MGLRWVVVVMCDDEGDARELAARIESAPDEGRPARVQQEAD